ncbi:MAG: phosphoglucomutase (alpha-D-glucose-1,6-bisphosphate-dependent) [Longimicrobiales bacterium]|nr:phosphoglucomutase (alpha-D-glucose-1,6-bisphosphate-dependent) [Longimicrobiales bacterium]
MATDPLAGERVPTDRLIDVPALRAAFSERRPDPSTATERVSFGTSGHRGSSLEGTFNEPHIRAIARAVGEYRADRGITGPMIVGKDTHALSDPAFDTAVGVLAAMDVELHLDSGSPYTPTPAVSLAVLAANRSGRVGRADGLILTPSHNPPEDGGIKYNPPHGGPAGGDVTAAIEARANELLEAGGETIEQLGPDAVRARPDTRAVDLRRDYVEALGDVVDMAAIAESGVRIGVDPLGGSSVDYWEAIADRWGLDIDVVNTAVDPTFGFMRLDWDGKVRMDCSSPHAMAGLIELKDRYDIAIGLDPDADRHGIVTPLGLMNPNHYLAVAVWYLFEHRPDWGSGAGVGKTLVSSSMIDRVAADQGRRLVEVPVGFKWFVDGLTEGRIAFAGEESAGATLLRRDGTPWTTDKDGIVMGLLAAEITARTGRHPGELYAELADRFGAPVYERIDAPATPGQKAALKALSPESVEADELAGETVVAKLTRAPGNDAPIGGLKVVTKNGWFAARPSGTEDVYKIYAESFRGSDHLARIQEEARAIVAAAFREQGVA